MVPTSDVFGSSSGVPPTTSTVSVTWPTLRVTGTASDRSLSAARKRFLPQLRLSASGGAAISTLLADPITIWSLGGSILAPIFEGGRITAQVEGAAAQRDQAAFAYRRLAEEVLGNGSR